MSGSSPRPWTGRRRLVLLLVALSGVWASIHLRLTPAGLLPGEGGLRVAGRFFAAAAAPAVAYEAEFVPPDPAPFLRKVAQAAWATLVFAICAASLSTVLGVALGFLASTAWWAGDPAGGAGVARRALQRTLRPSLYGVARVAIALLRSVHELLWAVLFLAAMGLTPLTAVIAIAIPYTGTLAKVFSEVVDEAPRDAAMALRGTGASPLMVYCWGLLPRAMPDVIAYALYRFECALRSSAVVGFFGVTTFGYYIRQSFEELHYREVWTHLYVLLLLIVLVDQWSGAIRRRLTT